MSYTPHTTPARTTVILGLCDIVDVPAPDSGQSIIIDPEAYNAPASAYNADGIVVETPNVINGVPV